MKKKLYFTLMGIFILGASQDALSLDREPPGLEERFHRSNLFSLLRPIHQEEEERSGDGEADLICSDDLSLAADDYPDNAITDNLKVQAKAALHVFRNGTQEEKNLLFPSVIDLMQMLPGDEDLNILCDAILEFDGHYIHNSFHQEALLQYRRWQFEKDINGENRRGTDLDRNPCWKYSRYFNSMKWIYNNGFKDDEEYIFRKLLEDIQDLRMSLNIQQKYVTIIFEKGDCYHTHELLDQELFVEVWAYGAAAMVTVQADDCHFPFLLEIIQDPETSLDAHHLIMSILSKSQSGREKIYIFSERVRNGLVPLKTRAQIAQTLLATDPCCPDSGLLDNEIYRIKDEIFPHVMRIIRDPRLSLEDFIEVGEQIFLEGTEDQKNKAWTSFLKGLQEGNMSEEKSYNAMVWFFENGTSEQKETLRPFVTKIVKDPGTDVEAFFILGEHVFPTWTEDEKNEVCEGFLKKFKQDRDIFLKESQDDKVDACNLMIWVFENGPPEQKDQVFHYLDTMMTDLVKDPEVPHELLISGIRSIFQRGTQEQKDHIHPLCRRIMGDPKTSTEDADKIKDIMTADALKKRDLALFGS